MPCGTGKLPLPWLGLVGCTPLGQSDRVFKALDEVLGRAFPAGESLSPQVRLLLRAGRSGIEPGEPCTPPRQSSVFRVVSKGPTRLWPETLRSSAGALRYATAACASGICTHITSSDMYSNRQSVCIQWATKLLAREIRMRSVDRDSTVLNAAIAFQRSNPCTPTGSRPFSFSLKPNEDFTETWHFQENVVPAGSWACIKTIQRSKRFRRASSYQDVVRTTQLDSQTHWWESNPSLDSCCAGSRLSVWLTGPSHSQVCRTATPQTPIRRPPSTRAAVRWNQSRNARCRMEAAWLSVFGTTRCQPLSLTVLWSGWRILPRT